MWFLTLPLSYAAEGSPWNPEAIQGADSDTADVPTPGVSPASPHSSAAGLGPAWAPQAEPSIPTAPTPPTWTRKPWKQGLLASLCC